MGFVTDGAPTTVILGLDPRSHLSAPTKRHALSKVALGPRVKREDDGAGGEGCAKRQATGLSGSSPLAGEGPGGGYEGQ